MRQRIVMCQKLDTRLGLFSVADVTQRCHAMRDATIHKILAHQFHGDPAAIVANQRDFVRPLKPGTYVADHHFEVFGRDEFLNATPDQFGAR